MTLSKSNLLAVASLALALTASASVARAQADLMGVGRRNADATITVRAAKREMTADLNGGVVTTPFMIVNGTADSLGVSPRILVPKDWTIVTAIQPSVVAAAGRELWLVSVAPPAFARAGRYVIRAEMGVKRTKALAKGEVWAVMEQRDSVVVTIPERRELDLRAARTVGFVMAGDSYAATFTLRNRGNVPVHLKVAAKSNQGCKSTLNAAQLDLDAGASTTITASVSVDKKFPRSAQDLLEVAVNGTGTDTTHAETSVETTIIPVASATATQYWTLPGQVALRGAPSGIGVAPFVAWGTGRISENSKTVLDFSLRSSAGPQSTFGEREEYRASLHNDHFGIRGGDDSYGFSVLTSSGIQGMGGELKAMAGPLAGGVYMQRNRWNPLSAMETAAMIGTAPNADAAASIVALERGKAGADARVLAATAGKSLFGSRIELEGAKSDSNGTTGTAQSARLTGATTLFTYDIGAQSASTGFAGAQRASVDEHGTVSANPIGPVRLAASASLHTLLPTALSGGFGQRMGMGTFSANLSNGSALEYERLERADRGASYAIRGIQQGLRARGRIHLGFLDLLGSVQRGIVLNQDSATTRPFMNLSGSLRVSMGPSSYISLFTDMSDGMMLGAGGVGTLTGGTTADLQLPLGVWLRVMASVTSQRDRMADWAGQSDISLEHSLGKSIVALRGRMAQSGSGLIPPTNAFFFEVRTPLSVPLSRITPSGRARARVVNAETGRGVQGALVRIGTHAAITDAQGTAEFVGIEAGEYHPVVERGVSAGQMVTSGSSIKIVAGANRAADVQVNVGRAAQVAANLRRYESKHIGGPAADSLIETGVISQAMVALISAHDTVWQSSDDRGHVDFGSIAPGHYILAVQATDIPDYFAFEQSRIEITVAAGEQRDVDFRLLPQQRTVQFVGEETTLVAAPVKPPIKPAPRPKAP